jgi:nucleoside-diphosphate-sugar epimerase
VLELDKVLVTGGSGFIGSFLVERLLKEGCEVKVFDNNFRGREDYIADLKGKIEVIKGDIVSFEQVKNAFKRVDTVFHLAAINGTEYFYKIPDRVLNVNTKGTINTVEALEGSEVEKYVFFSSSEVYGTPEYYPTDEKHKLVVSDSSNPRFTYSGSKIIGEIYTHTFCNKLGIDYSIIRPHNIYGPKMGYEHVIPQFITRIVKKEEFTIQGDGSQTRSYCYISDAIDGIMAIGNKKTNGETFNLGNDKEEITALQLSKIVAEVAGVQVMPKFVHLLAGSTPRRKPSIDKARKLLGYEPKVSLREGLKLTFEWYYNDILKDSD